MKKIAEEEIENVDYQSKEEIYSTVIRSGKRTYFLDVKSSHMSEPYLTITESKRKADKYTGEYTYAKSKIVIQKEDLRIFELGIRRVIDFLDKNHIKKEQLSDKKDSKSVTTDTLYSEIFGQDE